MSQTTQMHRLWFAVTRHTSWSITAHLYTDYYYNSFLFIIAVMRKAKGGGHQGDSIQDALSVSKGGERECV